MKTTVLLAVLSAAGVFFHIPLRGAESGPEAIVMISGNDMTLNPVSCQEGDLNHPKWAGDASGGVLVGTFPSGTDWSRGSFSFLPESDGAVTLIIRGPLVKSSGAEGDLLPVLVDFDEISVEGATIVNGGFEEVTSSEVPEGWKYYVPSNNSSPITEENRARVVQGNAAEGSNFARVWQNSAFSTLLRVEAGKEVKITFLHREAPVR